MSLTSSRSHLACHLRRHLRPCTVVVPRNSGNGAKPRPSSGKSPGHTACERRQKKPLQPFNCPTDKNDQTSKPYRHRCTATRLGVRKLILLASWQHEPLRQAKTLILLCYVPRQAKEKLVLSWECHTGPQRSTLPCPPSFLEP